MEIAGEFAEGGFGFADAQVARLLECGERVIDARDGLLVRLDVEVADGVVDELGGRIS